MADMVELKGRVVMRKFAEGSKSEHDAVFLETDGNSYHLRRLGGNPFDDPTLKAMVGKTISARGLLNDELFIAHEINEG
ncbi:hypothetical protein [Puia sp.]|jgi:hypothetical protein|uniref:hypothetical protein n=1 Tax=Puia sp. TaxID=2045100 RepID=UPI002F42ADD0